MTGTDAGPVAERLVVLGRISGIFGVCGWLRVYSHTQPRDNILQYPRWLVRQRDGWQEFVLLDGRAQGKGVVACLDGITSRDEARLLMGADVAVPREELPAPGEGEYYWADLEGLRVYSGDVCLGRVSHLVETGANDVMVVRGERERLIPFVPGSYVIRVDLDADRIEVDWDPDF